MLLLATAIGVAGWLFFQNKVHSELRSQIQSKVDSKLAQTGLQIKIGSARFEEGRGLRLNNVTVGIHARPQSSPNDANSAQSFADDSNQIEIYEAFIHAPISMTQLVSTELKPRAIEIRRAKFKIRKQPDGRWNILSVIEALQSLNPQSPIKPIPVSLTDCEIEVFDPSLPDARLQLTNVFFEVLPVVHEGRSLFQITTQFQGRDFAGMKITSFVDPHQRTWQAEFTGDSVRLSKHLLTMLPDAVKQRMGKPPEIHGLASFTGTAAGTTSIDATPSFRFGGRIEDLSCDDIRLPFPISQASSNFHVENQKIQITDATGRLGQGNFRFNYQQTGLIERKTWNASGDVTQLDFKDNRKFVGWLPESSLKFCRDFSPMGSADVRFKLDDNGTRLTRNIQTQLNDMSFTYVKLPYRIDHCVGEIRAINEDVTFDISSRQGQQIIKIDGYAKNPGPELTFEVNISVPGELPIDTKALTALKTQPRISKIVNDFSPTGLAGGIARIERRIPGGATLKAFDIRLKQCNLRHRHFNYPINNVSGLVEVRNTDLKFTDLVGGNGSGRITADGTWNKTEGLNLVMMCESVPLDDQLRFALKPKLREIWQGFRPRGTMDLMRVDLKLPIGQAHCDVGVVANMATPAEGDDDPNYVSIHPTWFPYEIKRLTGTVTIGDGTIDLKDMKGQHRRTWMVCQGDGHYADESWSVKLKNLLVGSLKVDEDLIAAIPQSLAPAVQQLSYEGLVNVQGEITLAGQHAPDTVNGSKTVSQLLPEASTSLAWDLQFLMNQAKMKIGLPLENVFGIVRLIGHSGEEETDCRGELNIDSLTIYDAQVTNIKGPIWLNSELTAAGIFASPQSARPTGSTVTSRQITPKQTGPNFSPLVQATPPQSITGKMHGGLVKFDAQMGLGPAGEFYLQTTLADGNLKQFCREFAPQLTDVAGRSYAALRLTGDYHRTHSIRGDGTIQLRDAEIYELPVILSLLKILKIRQVNRTAFDSSNVSFTVSGDQIDFGRIELLGDAISLIGNGKMNLDREIDLNFYSIMGRNRINIPLLTDLYRAGAQQIMWINIDGSLDNPQTHRSVLPHLNDSLRHLFQPPDRSNTARNFNRGNGSGFETSPSNASWR